jgi:hypothetical protein
LQTVNSAVLSLPNFFCLQKNSSVSNGSVPHRHFDALPLSILNPTRPCLSEWQFCSHQ